MMLNDASFSALCSTRTHSRGPRLEAVAEVLNTHSTSTEGFYVGTRARAKFSKPDPRDGHSGSNLDRYMGLLSDNRLYACNRLFPG